MSWLYIALGVLAVWVEEQPHHLARFGLRLQIDRKSSLKQILAIFLRYSYISARIAHEKFHSAPPQDKFDKLALAIWLKGSQLINNSIAWLRNRVSLQPTWDKDSERLIEAYKRVYPKPQDTGRKLGKGGIDWVSVGFQGDDPFSDFRAAGMLGLDHFAGFCNNYTQEARRLATESGSLIKSDDPCWYSLALASIFISNAMAELLLEEPLFVACISGQRMIFIEMLGNVHNRLLISFHNGWMTEKQTGVVKTVMDTDNSLKRFKANIPNILWDMRA